MENKYFLVTSYGRTASYWLTSCLNLHPRVSCIHGKTLKPLLSYDVQPSDDETLYIHSVKEDFNRKRLDDIFDMLEKGGNADVYGMVHSYAAQDLFVLPHIYPSSRKIITVNLTRHPISRIESSKRRFLYELNFNPYLQKDILNDYGRLVTDDVVDLVVERYHVDMQAMENKMFLYACFFVIENDSIELERDMPHVPIERLTNDIDYYDWFFRTLTQGVCVPGSDYLFKVKNSKRMNFQADEISAAARYASWPEWMKFVLSLAIIKQGVRLANYDKNGYYLPCVKELLDDDAVVGRLRTPRPQIVELNYHSFNILRYGRHFIALSQSLGEIKVMTLPDSERICLEEKKLYLSANSLDEIKKLVFALGRQNMPKFLGSYKAYNIIRYSNYVYGVAQALGAFNLAQVEEARLEEFKRSQMCFVGSSIEEIKDVIDGRVKAGQ